MQYIEDDPFPFDAGISNIPNVHIYGIEGEASYVSPDSRLHINANLALEEGHVSGNFLTIDSHGGQRHRVPALPKPLRLRRRLLQSGLLVGGDRVGEEYRRQYPAGHAARVVASIDASYAFPRRGHGRDHDATGGGSFIAAASGRDLQ